MKMDDDSNNDEIDVKEDDINNYKGFFNENPEEDYEPKYFEFGAHFPYRELYNALIDLKEKQIREEKGKQIEKIIQINKKKIANKERNNTKVKNKENNNLNNIVNVFKYKGRSRNVGIDIQSQNQNDLTFVPKMSFKNNLSVKKEDKNQSKSLYAYKTNFNKESYLKIYKNINNKIRINSNSNKKINNSNKKYKKTVLNQNKINKYSDKYIINRNKKNIYQQINIFPNIKTLNKDNKNNCSCDINIQQSFQTQVKEIKSNTKTKNKLETLTFNPNLQEIINKNKSLKKESKYKNQNPINKNNVISIKKGNNSNKKEKIKNSNSSKGNQYNLNKINKKIISTPLECLLDSYKSKKNKYSPDINKKNILERVHSINNNYYNSSYKTSFKNKNDIRNISLPKYIPKKINESSNLCDSKGIISISMDNNKKKVFEQKAEKYKKNKANNYKTQTLNNNATFPNISTDNINKSINKINKKAKESNNIKDGLNYLYEKNEKNSRNNNINFLIKNTSSVNYTDNININTINNNDELAKINKTQNTQFTQQNQKLFKNKYFEIKQNKTFNNIKKNKNKSNERNKKNLIGIPSSSKKKSYVSQMEKNLFNNYNSTSFVGKKFNNNKINNSYINKIIINKSKHKINITNDVIHNLKNSENNYNNNKKNIQNINKNNNCIITGNNNPNIIRLSKITQNLKNNSVTNKDVSIKKQTGLKKYQSLLQKKDNKNNINISININNNNNIIYNKIINSQSINNNNTSSSNNKKNKIPLKINIQKIIKSPSIKKNKISPSNTKSKNNVNVTSLTNNNNGKNKNLQQIKNNNTKIDDKVKFINIQFPKAKFLNIYNTNNK